MERPLIVFDGDDTLWYVEPLYDDARMRAAALVSSAGLSGDGRIGHRRLTSARLTASALPWLDAGNG